MVKKTLKNGFSRKSLKIWAADAKEGSIDRREFLALASIFGVSTAAAYGMLGLARSDAGVRRYAEEGRRDPMRHVRQGSEGPAHLRLAGDGQRRAPVPRAARTLYARVHFQADAARELGRQWRRDRICPSRPEGRDLEQWRSVHRRRRRLQSEPLVRQERRRQFDGLAHGRAHQSGHQEGARRSDHQGRRSHRQADAAQARHHHHPRRLRLPRPHRASQLRRHGEGSGQASDRHRPVRARVARGRQKGRVQEADRRQMVGRRRLSRRR